MSSSCRSFRSPAYHHHHHHHHQPHQHYDDQDTSPLDFSSFRPGHEQDEEAVELLKSDLRFTNDSISEIDLEREHHSGLLRPRWSTLRTALTRLRSRWHNSANTHRFLSADESRLGRAQKRSVRSKKLRWLLYSIIAFLAMLGLVQFFVLACAIVVSFFPDELEQTIGDWGQPGTPTEGWSHWPTDATREIVPVGCHSHNDYWRKVPLFSALQAGCIGVEADVWLAGDELYVGHTTSALTANRTLKSLYVNPLVELLEKQNPVTSFHPAKDQPLNGVFDTDPSQTLILLIDFKTDGPATWPHVVSQLSPLRERGYLTYFNGTDVVQGPVTVVGTGDTPFNLLTANSTYRDIFFDAPLAKLEDEGPPEMDPEGRPLPRSPGPKRLPHGFGQGHSGLPSDVNPDIFDPTNSYYASVSFKKSIGLPWHFHITPRQLERIRAQVRGAHRRGLKVRYWGLPSWPRSLRNHVWSVLMREGVDILNVDDLKSATRRDWTRRSWRWWFA
ncbi:hypothetical protein DTO166G4_5828 [Paecilomyces variotii]|uniref:Altered inheritance of mitochondria protein 6 n=1 Tax=Byssochlamys spectabilis TaxID=264951 RepID=A0A443HQ53_BYSSP|nr:PLC-like phosphodiesterase [Paecilomyces variotii]KAJ9212609.1 hypothetical protein DTO166G4_5828 [Paecilomyces variotii]KAJ9228185.1 hypothetical protein DTO166G5_8778 [Paecilomyces variotii]KAJ9304839.1 hypothetical protein DTO217A2_5648 [Paecilomyces variotii]KAJ9362818.1 hypothetical protein DTO280E4_3167 [Paecilomyces variotii]RWQ93931.1 PLC-like phosphodiesterase [Paecilomyces variotii]